MSVDERAGLVSAPRELRVIVIKSCADPCSGVNQGLALWIERHGGLLYNNLFATKYEHAVHTLAAGRDGSLIGG